VKTPGGEFASLGTHRLAVLQFLLMLVTEEPDICTILIETGFYSTALDIFFLHPTNSIVHDIILQFFLLICARDEDEIKEVFIQTKLLDQIGNVWEDYMNNKRSNYSSGGKKVNSYFGHFAILATIIIDTSEKLASITELMDKSDKWKKFTAPNLDQYNLQMISISTI